MEVDGRNITQVGKIDIAKKAQNKESAKRRFFCVTQQFQDGDIYLYEENTSTLKAMQKYIENLRIEFNEDDTPPKPLEWVKMSIDHDQWRAEDSDVSYQIFERVIS